MHIEYDDQRAAWHVILPQTQPWSSESFYQNLDTSLSAIKKEFLTRPANLILDFSRLSRIDSSIIALAVQVIRLVSESFETTIISPHCEATDLLELMGLDKLATITEQQ
ncbi:MAG: hypothetical protein GF398_19460 [Chitinivibrionales bacterium]|nr:hypothetical protein [Chitinivibrionales bacterium]